MSVAPGSRKEYKHGLTAENQDFSKYDQVEKSHTYKLCEGVEDQFDDSTEISTCDMVALLRGDAGAEEAFATALGQSLEATGFAILTGHGVDVELYKEAEQKTIDVFTKTSLEKKLEYRAQRQGSVSQGYFPIEETSDIHPDQVEGWVFGRRAFNLADRGCHEDPEYVESKYWPLEGCEETFRKISEANLKLVPLLMQAMMRHIEADPHCCDDKLARTHFAVRLNYYPPLEEDKPGGRLLGHEDTDVFTMLPAPTVEGLQVYNCNNEKWIRVAAPPGSIIINIGDYMQRISNDLFRSTTHRVARPRDASLRAQARTSFPMAVYFYEDASLEVVDSPRTKPKKYEPIPALTFHTRTMERFYGEGYAAN